MKAKLFTLLLSLTVSVETFCALEGALPGFFSVSPGQQVQFSQGNLQYQASTETWRFALDQWNYIGSYNQYISSSYSGYIDLFGWGTGNNPTMSLWGSSYYTTYVDWGVNAISNGGNETNVWRTLTNSEWLYLFHGRDNATTLFGLGNVAGTNGTIILPDDWETPEGATFEASTTRGLVYIGGYENSNGDNYSHNVYSTEEWALMEAAGAVFLPAAGSRNETYIYNVQDNGEYWSSSLMEPSWISYLIFTSHVVYPDYTTDGKSAGRSVRLVYDTISSNCYIKTGECGENLTYKLYCDGVMTVSGTGDMYDYDSENQSPWFEYKSNIKSVVIADGVTGIGDRSFYQCDEISSIEIPNSVTRIGETAFAWCSNLSSVVFGNDLTSIGDYAFRECTSLTSVTNYATEPQEINNNTFADDNISDCTLYVPEESVAAYQAAYIWMDFGSIQEIPLTFYERVQIGDLYFNLDAENQTAEVTYQNNDWPYWSTTITTANIPASVTYKDVVYNVTSIGNSAFYNCSSLTSVNIPSSVTSIGSSAFGSCSALTSVTIPNSVTSIGNSAFSGCTGLTSPVYNAHVFAFMPTTYSGSYTVPDGIETIAGYSFYQCGGLTSVTIPNSVTSISDNAFGSCKGLLSMTIGNNVTSIGNYAFSWCTGMPSVTIPNSVTSIGINAFSLVPNIMYDGIATGSPWGARSINGFVDGLLVYSDATRSNILACSSKCTGEIVIASSVTNIGRIAFAYCEELTSVIIPYGVTNIDDGAFNDCFRLANVSIPNSVTRIGNSAFFWCSDLTSVEIPNSVTYIGPEAFGLCGLTSITCKAIIPPTLEGKIESKINLTTPLYVPAESVEAYSSAPYWIDYINIQAIPELLDLTANEDPLSAGVYYTTFYNSTQRYVLPDNGTEAYVADLSGGELLLTRIAQGGQVLPNNVAVIFRAPTSTITLTETSAAGVSFSAENDLRGVDAETSLASLSLTRSTCYVLSGNNTDGVGFYQCNSDNLKAHKAYLPYAGAPAGAPRRMRFVFGGTTDVGQLQSDKTQSAKILRNGQLIIIRNGVEYNTAGQIVQ